MTSINERDNGCTVTPPVKPLTFEDVVPMTEAPPKGAVYWVISAAERDGVCFVRFVNGEFDHRVTKRRMAYLDKEHALIAAKHIFGLKGGASCDRAPTTRRACGSAIGDGCAAPSREIGRTVSHGPDWRE